MTRRIRLPKRELWLRRIASGAVAAGMSAFFALYLIPNSALDFAIAMPIIVAAGAIGSAIFYLTAWSPKKWFWGGQLAFAIVAVGVCWILANALVMDPKDFKACQVCGYKTLKANGAQCGVCGVVLNEKAMKEAGYAHMEDLVMEQQLIYFAMQISNGTVDFFKKEQGAGRFAKDSTWKPVVTAEEVMAMKAAADSLKRGPGQ
jgi:hypothetical protein